MQMRENWPCEDWFSLFVPLLREQQVALGLFIVVLWEKYGLPLKAVLFVK